jgi:hypothetical protein
VTELSSSAPLAHRKSTALNVMSSIVSSGDENVRHAISRLSLTTQRKFMKFHSVAEEELAGIRKFAMNNKAVIKANRLRKQLYYTVNAFKLSTCASISSTYDSPLDDKQK